MALLRKQAAVGSRYLEALRGETLRLGLLADEALDGDTLRSIVDKLEEPELSGLKASYEARLQKPPAPQLRYGEKAPGQPGGDSAFVI